MGSCVQCLPSSGVLDRSKGAAELDLFRSLKGDVETLLGGFSQGKLTFDTQTADYYDPGASARGLLDGKAVAQFGRLHPQIAATRKLRQQIYLAEIFADQLYARALREIRYQPLPKFPGVERDFSFIFPDEVTFGGIETSIRGLNLAELRSFEPVEIFRGGLGRSINLVIMVSALGALNGMIFTPQAAHRMAERIPSAGRPQFIRGAGHFLQEERGEEIGERIARFMSETA